MGGVMANAITLECHIPLFSGFSATVFILDLC